MSVDGLWKLLLVEDDTDSAESLVSLFDLHGIETLWAIDGPAALQALDSIHRLGERRPDFVLLDVNIPNTDTIELALEIRQHPISCPVVLISASSEQLLDFTARRVGAVAALRKPFSMDRLLAVLDHAVPAGIIRRSSAGRR